MSALRKATFVVEVLQWTTESAGEFVDALDEGMGVTSWTETETTIGVLDGGDVRTIEPGSAVIRLHDNIAVLDAEQFHEFSNYQADLS